MEHPNPTLIWNTMTAYQQGAALKAGVELGVFNSLGDGPLTAAQLASRANVPERGIRILCDYLTIFGLLAKAGDQYSHTPSSAVFLDNRSPASMAPTLPFLMNAKILSAFSNLTETIRQGHTTLAEPLAGEEVAEWVLFARTMQPMMASAAEFMADLAVAPQPPAKVLDVAASHGLFGFAVARRAPQCQLVALDFPSVLEVTQEHADAAGIPITLLPGSAFTADLGTDYDLILVTNLFHHFSSEDNISLLNRFHAALRPGGRLMILEMVPHPDRITPPAPASFSMMMLANTPAGDAFTMAEYDHMLNAANFGPRQLLNVPMSPQQLIVAEKG
jgi:ubiquinone/menaquinone biosynthesis C-methylase UbiE